MIRTRIDPINRDIDLILQEELSPKAKTAHIAAYARTELKSAQDRNRAALGRVPPHETFVDGQKEAPLESVNPDRGTIIFEFELLTDVFGWIGEQLVRNSPHLTGRYADSHKFFADGVEVDPSGEIPPAKEYVFLNIQPYARKIERGLSDQYPDGVYQVVALLASKRFGNIAKVKFSYRSALLDYVAIGGRRGGKTAGAAKRSAHHIETESRVPAIVITTY